MIILDYMDWPKDVVDKFTAIYKSPILSLHMHYLKIIRRYGFVHMNVLDVNTGEIINTIYIYSTDRKNTDGNCVLCDKNNSFIFTNIHEPWNYYQKILESNWLDQKV